MPRYCAVKICRNRTGTASRQDNKRISFYPFPLQDKPRLQKWMSNMHREEWTPSRHQYICSEHFTEDCFDIRWGIRYLKNTAIPTFFTPPMEDDKERKNSTPTFKGQKPRPSLDANVEQSGFEYSHSKRPIIMRRTNNNSKMRIKNENNIDNFLDGIFELHSEEQPDSTVTVTCCESNGEAALDTSEPVSLVPNKIPLKAQQTNSGSFLEEKGLSEGENICVFEHSYSRPDTGKDLLWSKLVGLQAKILELQHREECTVARINTIQNEIALLKHDSAAFREKLNILEDYVSSLLL